MFSMSKIIGAIMTLAIGNATLAVHFGVDDEFERPRVSVKNKLLLEKRLFEIFPMQKLNSQRVAFSFERARGKILKDSTRERLFEQALEIQFNELIQGFAEDQRETLNTHWKDAAWVTFSDRAEYSIFSRPLGEAQFFGLVNFQLVLDKRLENLPLMTKLLKMIVLTHVIGPQLMVEESEGLAFSRATYATQDFLAHTSGFWTLSLWMEFLQVAKVLESEVKSSGLELKQIRDLLENIHSFGALEPVAGLNVFIKTHYSTLVGETLLKKYMQNWLNDSITLSPFTGIVEKGNPPKSAKIIALKPRISFKEVASCRMALSSEGDEAH